ncbi:hypothetical protein STCU_12295 [Strigomonas culicis]|uniref:Uncharacterized protein n=1 Tax=Strigomonas culicis TaxID=28005 RepID=S9UXB7_9TRYP|nr:hypothetical protein STCU_12295 [Strigomonas culicis]|eukprot:EPY15165.1 hypothetical protein STCU_12295 [Strigomonas culicis]
MHCFYCVLLLYDSAASSSFFTYKCNSLFWSRSKKEWLSFFCFIFTFVVLELVFQKKEYHYICIMFFFLYFFF